MFKKLLLKIWKESFLALVVLANHMGVQIKLAGHEVLKLGLPGCMCRDRVGNFFFHRHWIIPPEKK